MHHSGQVSQVGERQIFHIHVGRWHCSTKEGEKPNSAHYWCPFNTVQACRSCTPILGQGLQKAAIQWLIMTDQACCSYCNYTCTVELNLYSLSWVLNIFSFRKWIMWLLRLRMASKFLVARQLVLRSCICSRTTWRSSKTNSMYVLNHTLLSLRLF